MPVVRECRIAQVGRGAKAELNLGSPQMPQKARAAAVRPNRVVPPNTHATADFTNASRDGQFTNVEWSEADLSDAVWQAAAGVRRARQVVVGSRVLFPIRRSWQRERPDCQPIVCKRRTTLDAGGLARMPQARAMAIGREVWMRKSGRREAARLFRRGR
ncbi:hypothetical protein [Paraburkholderia tropica]|uniref:hypothetical protein n=1 Tax=Paraburkholderia tropica TaxID=92647 RepID=UPI0031E2A27A